MNGADFQRLKEAIALERKAINEIDSSFEHLKSARDADGKKMAREHINKLRDSIKKTNVEVLKELEQINIAKPLTTRKEEKEDRQKKIEAIKKNVFLNEGRAGKGDRRAAKELSLLERETIKRLRKGEERVSVSENEKPNKYIQFANQHFYTSALKLSFDKSFDTLKSDLVKTSLNFTPISYISVILLTTIISAGVAFFIFLFFLIFNVGFDPIIGLAKEGFGMRFLKVFWILFLVPIGTFFAMYFYPSVERKSLEIKINRELPFAAIHMAAISQSLIEPSKIFSIIIATKEYPTIREEFTKLINKLNIYGYDLITALKSTAINSASKKLADLLNGLATTITSGGDLREFFDKRSQTLLFEHRLEREKETKSAETFMDIYISMVIAAPMVLMLLLVMMRISGLGVALPTSSIALIMVLGVSLLNVAFLSFLHLKKSSS